MDNLISIKTVASVFEVSVSTIRNWINGGTFPTGFEVGRSVRWSADELEPFIESYINNKDDNYRKELVSSILNARKGSDNEI